MACCDWCKGHFTPIRDGHRFCSISCHNEWHVLNRREAMKAWERMQRQQKFFAPDLNRETRIDSKRRTGT
jgi:hypothetical protein